MAGMAEKKQHPGAAGLVARGQGDRIRNGRRLGQADSRFQGID